MLIPRIGGFEELFWKPVRRFDKWGILRCPGCRQNQQSGLACGKEGKLRYGSGYRSTWLSSSQSGGGGNSRFHWEVRGNAPLLIKVAISSPVCTPDSRKKKAFKNRFLKAFVLSNGRGERIRTFDPLVPNQMRYQAALRPDEVGL